MNKSFKKNDTGRLGALMCSDLHALLVKVVVADMLDDFCFFDGFLLILKTGWQQRSQRNGTSY